MKKRIAALLLIAFFVIPLCAYAQNYTQLWLKEAEAPVSSSDPLPVTASISGLVDPVKLMGVNGTTIMTNANPLSSTLSIAGAANSATNGMYFNLLQGNAVLSATNPIFDRLTIGAGLVSATNGIYSNLLQGNAVLTAANPIFSDISTGGAVVSNSNPLRTQQPTVTQANITNTTANVPNTDTAVTLTASSTHICVKTDPAAAILYVDFTNGAATTADFRIDPGAAITLDNLPGITSIHVIGASATGTYSVAAW